MIVVQDLAAQTELLGGKARQLAVAAADFRVPAFVVLAFDQGASPTAEEVASLDWEGVLPPSPTGLYAVRSSANIEDGGSNSFAGMFSSQLGVSRSAMAEAVVSVVRSADEGRVAEYLKARGIPAGDVRMSVVVQVMVDADVAGVAFSRLAPDDPRTVVEAVWGLGELLVSGAQEPDRYFSTEDGKQVVTDHVAHQRYALHLSETGPERVGVHPEDRSAAKCSPAQAGAVVDLSRQVERTMGYHAADIEWAWEAGVLYLLQAREYTGYSGSGWGE